MTAPSPTATVMGVSPARGTSFSLNHDSSSAIAPSPSSTAWVPLWVEAAKPIKITSATRSRGVNAVAMPDQRMETEHG